MRMWCFVEMSDVGRTLARALHPHVEYTGFDRTVILAERALYICTTCRGVKYVVPVKRSYVWASCIALFCMSF